MTFIDTIDETESEGTANIWFRAYEENGFPVIRRVGQNGAVKERSDFDSLYCGVENWTSALGLDSWEELLRLGVAPGQAFCMSLWWWASPGSYWEPPDFDSGWDGVEMMEELSQKKVVARWAAVLDRAKMLEVCDGYVDLRGRLS